MLEIYLFGSPRVVLNGAPVKISRRANRVLLYFLAAHSLPVGRNKIVEFIFPDNLNGHRSLRETLARLRKDLPEDALIATPETIGLDFSKIQVDVHEFNKRIKQIKPLIDAQSGNRNLPPKAYEACRIAAGLWDSSGFMGDFNMGASVLLEDWHIQTTSRLQSDILHVLAYLADHEAAAGNTKQAIDCLDQILKINSTHEDAHVRILDILIQSGDKNEARQRYRDAEHAFKRNGEELPESIFSRKERAYTTTSPYRRVNAWLFKSSSAIGYVSNKNHLEKLHHCYRNASGALINGEMGAGKTRLALEFYKTTNPPPRLFASSCDLVGQLPYQPWVDILKREITPGEWHDFDLVLLKPLVRLLPDIKQWRTDIEEDVVDYSATAIFNSFLNIFEHLADKNKLLIVLDDLHAADDITIDLALYLLRNGFFSNDSAFIVLTARLEGLTPAFERFRLECANLNVEQVHLNNLDKSEIEQMAFHVLKQPVPPKFVENLLVKTGGNPFYVNEMLRALLQSSQYPNLEWEKKLPLPETLNASVEKRVRLLSKPAQEVLQYAAMFGNRFSTVMLERTVPLSHQKIANALDEVEKAHIIRNAEDDHLEYIFTNDIIRETLLNSVRTARSIFMHRKIAESLEEIKDDFTSSRSAAIAHHYQEAQDFSRAFDYWIDAAIYAHSLGAIQDATAAFSNAERLIELTEISDEQLYRLYSSWSDLAFEHDDHKTLYRLNYTLLPIARARGSDLLIGNALDGLSDACMSANRFAEGLEYTKEALLHLERSDNLFELLETQSHRGVFLYMLGGLRESQVWFEKTIQASVQNPDPLITRSRAHAYYQMGITQTLMGYPISGSDYGARSLGDFASIKWTYGRIIAYSLLGISHYYRANHMTGYELSEKGIELAQRVESWRMLGYLNGYAGVNAVELGWLDKALEHAQRTIQIGTTYGHNEITSIGYKILGDLYTHLTAYDKAIHAYQKGIEIAGETFVAFEHTYRLGFILALTGNESGLNYLQGTIEKAKAIEIGSFRYSAELLNLFFVARRQGEEQFEECARFLAGEIRANTGVDVAPMLDRLRGELAYNDGKFEKARDFADSACRKLLHSSSVWLRLRACNLAYNTAQKLGEDPSAHKNFIQGMLQEMQGTVTDPSLQEMWKNYQNMILSDFPLRS